MPTLPLWRSMLYVPAHVDQFVAKAHTRAADAIQLDLEDSVPPNEKAEARRKIPDAAVAVSRNGADVVVRINRPWRLAVRDIEAAVCPPVGALALPKVDSPEHVRTVEEMVTELEREQGREVGGTRLIAMIETAAGFLQAGEIARSSRRLVGLTLGSEDFALSVGVAPDPDIIAYPKQHVVIAARSAGVLPLGLVGTVAGYQDLVAFREVARRSRRVGCQGASAIHPSQVPILNEEFAPRQDEVDHARRVVHAYDEAVAGGRGAVSVDGWMIDAPVVERARALLDIHDRINAKQGAARE